jgi:hypothetical protein
LDSGYGSLVNVRVMAGVTAKDGLSPADAELTLYLEKVADIIDTTLKGAAEVPLSPVPQIIDTIAEFYATGLFLSKNSLADNQTEHPNVVLAEKKLAEFKTSLRRSFKLVNSK